MEFLGILAKKFEALFLSAGSMASLYSLAFAFIIATSYIFLKRKRRNWRILKLIFRKLVHHQSWFSKSSQLDMKFLICNTMILPGFILLAVASYEWIGEGVYSGLELAFGAAPAPWAPEWLSSTIITLMLFLAYEFAYYSYHYISHKVPFIWEFHKVHHNATNLTPITNWRMHPVDSIFFWNMIAICTGIIQSITHYVVGEESAPYLVQSENLFFLVYIYLYGHLQHSHVWMTFSPFWSKIFMSPASHQIHHSMKTKHFDKNFGGAFAFYDWMFGTLYLPSEKREVHAVGVKPDPINHSLTLSLLHPFYEVFAMAKKKLTRPNDAKKEAVEP